MRREVEIALWTYLIPLASTRALKIGAFILLGILGLVGVNVMIRVVSETFAETSLRILRQGAIVPGVPLFAILLSEMPLRDGLRQRTLLYPLLGPSSRATLAIVRTTATAGILALGMSFVVIVVRLLEGDGLSPLGGELLAVWLGAAAYVPLFGILHLITGRGLIGGLAFYFLFDALLALFPFTLRNFSTSFHIKVLADQVTEWTIPIPITPPPYSVITSVIALVGVAVVASVIGARIFSKKDIGEVC